jgi:acyl carrier protein
MELIVRFEDDLDIEIPDSDVDKFNRVGDAIDYVEQLLRNKG